jgi:hypothetical protein
MRVPLLARSAYSRVRKGFTNSPRCYRRPDFNSALIRKWVSSNRTAICPDGEEEDDSLGYYSRIITACDEWLYELKSALN